MSGDDSHPAPRNIWKDIQTWFSIAAGAISLVGGFVVYTTTTRADFDHRIDALERQTKELVAQRADQTRWMVDQLQIRTSQNEDRQATTTRDVAELKAGIGVVSTKLDYMLDLLKREKKSP